MRENRWLGDAGGWSPYLCYARIYVTCIWSWMFFFFFFTMWLISVVLATLHGHDNTIETERNACATLAKAQSLSQSTAKTLPSGFIGIKFSHNALVHPLTRWPVTCTTRILYSILLTSKLQVSIVSTAFMGVGSSRRRSRAAPRATSPQQRVLAALTVGGLLHLGVDSHEFKQARIYLTKRDGTRTPEILYSGSIHLWNMVWLWDKTWDSWYLPHYIYCL
jgi:hypothetical protein